jgi:predicted nucleotidyltransferase
MASPFDIAMSTIGFREALAFAPIYRLRDAPPLDIRVASAAGIAALKLIAWAAAYPLRKRDAIDFRFIRFPLHSDKLRRGYNRSTVFG